MCLELHLGGYECLQLTAVITFWTLFYFELVHICIFSPTRHAFLFYFYFFFYLPYTWTHCNLMFLLAVLHTSLLFTAIAHFLLLAYCQLLICNQLVSVTWQLITQIYFITVNRHLSRLLFSLYRCYYYLSVCYLIQII